MAYGTNHAKAQHAAFVAWQNKIKNTLDFLEKQLWAPIIKALPAGVQQMLLMPSGVTNLLPLHAAAPAHLSVAYIPSLTVWQQSRRRATTRKTESLFLATPADDLPFTEAEAEWLTQRFPAGAVTRLLRPQATAHAVQMQATGHGIVHFSGHARYDWSDASQSALACLDNPLTLGTIKREMNLRAARLVTLSACETGITDITSGEEFIGLPAALLEAGAPAVVATLWPVHDVSTVFLMDRFYELWLNKERNSNLNIAQALHHAAHWLRHASKADLLQRIAESPLDEKAQKRVQKLLKRVIAAQTARMSMSTALSTSSHIATKADEYPFAHPFYWAAFAAYGAVL